MIKIRLDRRGAKKDPFFRIVVIEEKRKRGGKPIDKIGFWHPKTGKFQLDKEKFNFWLKVGAKTTTAVDKLISKQ